MRVHGSGSGGSGGGGGQLGQLGAGAGGRRGGGSAAKVAGAIQAEAAQVLLNCTCRRSPERRENTRRVMST